MFIKTNIPETTQCLTGLSVDFGDRMFDQQAVILNDRTNQIQAVIISGNRCGHVPDAPRFYHGVVGVNRRNFRLQYNSSSFI